MKKFKLTTISMLLLASISANITYAVTQNFSYTYNMDNELTSINNAQETFNYDANGNLVSDNQGHVYSYDLENELMHYANASGTTANYTYYPNSMRATKQVNNGIPVTFYYNGDKYAQIVNEAQGNNDYTSYAMLGNNRYIRIVHQLGSSTPITKQYLIKDNKNVIAELDKDQNINKAHVYNPYGTQTDVDGLSSQNTSTQASTNGSFNILNNPFTYESEYNDSESGLVYLRARYYSPDLMRFISRDTADLPNRYNYADGNPISNIDPSGHSTFGIIINIAIVTTAMAALNVVAPEASLAAEMPLSGLVSAAGQAAQNGIDKNMYHEKVNWASSEGAAAASGVITPALDKGIDKIPFKFKTSGFSDGAESNSKANWSMRLASHASHNATVAGAGSAVSLETESLVNEHKLTTNNLANSIVMGAGIGSVSGALEFNTSLKKSDINNPLSAGEQDAYLHGNDRLGQYNHFYQHAICNNNVTKFFKFGVHTLAKPMLYASDDIAGILARD